MRNQFAFLLVILSLTQLQANLDAKCSKDLKTIYMIIKNIYDYQEDIEKVNQFMDELYQESLQLNVSCKKQTDNLYSPENLRKVQENDCLTDIEALQKSISDVVQDFSTVDIQKFFTDIGNLVSSIKLIFTDCNIL